MGRKEGGEGVGSVPVNYEDITCRLCCYLEGKEYKVSCLSLILFLTINFKKLKRRVRHPLFTQVLCFLRLQVLCFLPPHNNNNKTKKKQIKYKYYAMSMNRASKSCKMRQAVTANNWWKLRQTVTTCMSGN